MQQGRSMKSPTSSASVLAAIPVVLTVTIVGLAGLLGALYSWPLVALCLGTCPVALVILWMTRDVIAPQERIDAVDHARAARQVPLPAPASVLARAA
jgi:hypothetical protein